MKYFTIYFLILTLSIINILAQTPDSCLKVYNNHLDSTFVNPYFVKVDSCSGSPTYGEFYGKEFFRLKVEYNIIPRDFLAPEDTIIEYTWQDILPQYTDARNEFQQFEQMFGTFYFRDPYPNEPDTSQFIKRSLALRFDHYVNIDSAENALKSITCLKSAMFVGWFKVTTYIPSDVGFRSMTPFSVLQAIPDPSGNVWKPMKRHKRGWSWHHFSIKTPLAWEITRGSDSIFIGSAESLGNPINHPDMIGNYVEFSTANGNKGDGFHDTEPIRGGHGLNTMSCAIADDNNDHPMVGSCPDCKGFLIDWGHGLKYIWEIDVDMTVGNGIKVPQVVYQAAGYSGYDVPEMFDNGMVALGAAGNYLALTTFNQGEPDMYRMLYPAMSPPYSTTANSSWMHRSYPDPTDPSNPNKFVKVITVGGLSDGVFRDELCNPWQQTGSFLNPNWSGEERFISFDLFSLSIQTGNVFAFSYDINKFHSSITERNKAYVDVVVPSISILNADNSPQRYGLGTGTSQGVAIVAGVAGLMRSTNEFLSQNSVNGIPLNMYDVQRNSYNILTFTADKVPDDGMLPSLAYYASGIYPVSETFKFGINGELKWQYFYKEQENDLLKRTWSQRMGFGKVNAYRAVAHSIRQKGLYEYSIAGNFLIPFLAHDINLDPRGYVNPQGKRVMHWGSRVKEGTGMFEMPIFRGPTTGNDGILNVLEWGGISLPGEFHNNQGVTKVTNSNNPNVRLKLTVPINCILAIDGVLFSEQPNACHYIITSGTGDSAGKILMEGYLKDIEIFGNLRLGDLIIESTINDGAASIPGAVGFGSGYESEMYGHITTLNYGTLYLWGNAHAKPGTIISLNGSEDLILHGTSELHLEHASRIETNQGRKLIVQNNTKLIVDPRSAVELDLEVNVKQGGEFIISDSAIVKLKKLNVEPGGTIRINHGSILSLWEQEHICNGHFIANGTTEKIRIVGNIGEHCLTYEDEEYTSFPHLTTQPTIYFRGECLQPFLTSITLMDVEFKNIAINAYNTQIMLPITNCEFLTHTKLTNPYFNFPYLLSLRYNNCDSCPSPLTSYVELDNCKFKDFAQPTSSINDQNNLNELEFRTGGIMIDGYKNVKVVSTQFANLEYGISSFDCDTVFINSSRFDSCGIGNYDFASYNVMCKDTFNVVQYGTIRDHSLVSKAFDNLYNITRIGYRAESSLTQKLRDNEFNEYLQGISISNTDLMIKDEPIPGIPDNYVIYGANKFEITPFPPQLTGYINKFITRDCERFLSTDINLENSKCLLEMECGRNSMSSNAVYHLRRDITDGGTVPPINVSYNHFQPNLIPRYSNLTLNWIPGTLQYTDSFKDYFCCGDLGYQSLELTCNWDTWHPEIDCIEFDNGLFVEQPPHGKIKNTYNDLYEKYNSDNNLTTKDIIEDYIQNKSLLIGYNYEKESNSKSTLNKNIKFLQLILDYKNDRVDRLDENDHPHAEYFKFLTKAKLSKLDVDEFLSTSSLLSFVRSRAKDTCSQNLSNIQNATNPGALKITSIAPVPISETGIICFSLSNDSKVSFSISNLIGTTSNSINVEKFFNPGNNCFELSFKDLSPGMYFITISDGVNSDTKNFIISR